MKAASFRALIGERQLFAVTRNAIPANRVSGFLETAMRETLHALVMTESKLIERTAPPVGVELTVRIIVGDAGDDVDETRNTVTPT